MPRPKKRSTNKSAFVRKHIDLPVDEIISKAKAAGVSLTPALVYKVRGRSKSSSSSSKPSAGSATAAKTGSATTAAKPKAEVAAPAKPAGRVGRPPSALSKAGFIRSQPLTMPARDVVSAAASRGLRLTANHVYAVRAASKKSGKSAAGSSPATRATSLSTTPASTTGRRPGRPRKNPIAPSALSHAAHGSSNGGGESVFRKLVVELGVSRAKALVTEVERKLAALVDGM